MKEYTAKFITTEEIALQFALAKGYKQEVEKVDKETTIETQEDGTEKSIDKYVSTMIPNPVTVHDFICQYFKEFIATELNSVNAYALEEKYQKDLEDLQKSKNATIDAYKSAVDQALEVSVSPIQ